jgi:hypothetical protein
MTLIFVEQRLVAEVPGETIGQTSNVKQFKPLLNPLTVSQKWLLSEFCWDIVLKQIVMERGLSYFLANLEYLAAKLDCSGLNSCYF